MAVFQIIVSDTVTPKLLGPPQENNSSCESTFDITIGASINDSITLNFSPTPGYINWNASINTGSGFVGIPNPHTFTYSGVTTLRVVMENNGVPNDSLEVQVNATNNTSSDIDNITLNRTSTGAIC